MNEGISLIEKKLLSALNGVSDPQGALGALRGAFSGTESIESSKTVSPDPLLASLLFAGIKGCTLATFLLEMAVNAVKSGAGAVQPKDRYTIVDLSAEREALYALLDSIASKVEQSKRGVSKALLPALESFLVSLRELLLRFFELEPFSSDLKGWG